MPGKLSTSFTPLTGSDFLAKVGGIVNALRNNADFPEPWVAPVGTLADLRKDFGEYQDAFHAAASGDRAHIAQRNEARENLTQRLKKLASYLELVADGDTRKLMGTGYDLRSETVRSSTHQPLAAPEGLTVKHGKLSGQMVLRAPRLAGAVSYEAAYAEGSPSGDSAWVDAGTFAGSSRIEVAGLTPGKVYWFRLRGINSAGPGAWCDPASLMVI